MQTADGLKAAVGGAMAGAVCVALVALLPDGTLDAERVIRGGVLGAEFTVILHLGKVSKEKSGPGTPTRGPTFSDGE